MKNLSKALAIALFLGFGLFTAATSFPQALNAAPPGNPPDANVNPTFTGVTLGTNGLKLSTATSNISNTSGDVKISDNLNVTGTTTSAALTTGGNLSVAGTSTFSGAADLKGGLINSTENCFGGFCLAYSLSINDNLAVNGNAGITGNTTTGGNLSVNGNTTLGNANTDTVTINGTQKTTQDIKSDRFIRAKVDSNGMGGIGRFYNKSREINMVNGSNLSDTISCDSTDLAVSCMGGFTDCAGSSCGISAIYSEAGGSSCRAKAYNSSGAAKNFKIQARCYAPDENWYYDNGSWKIMYYDGTLSGPIGL